MEISPDELCTMICNPTESSPEEVIELVDTYLCTTADMIIEAVHKRVFSCTESCRSKKNTVCHRLITSLLHQLAPLRNTEFISEQGKSYLTEMEKLKA